MVAIEVVPLDLLREVAGPEPTKARNGKARHWPGRSDFDIERWVGQFVPDAKGPEQWNGGRRWIVPSCPWNPDHDRGEAWVAEMASGAAAAGCRHESCTWGWRELRERLEPGCYDKRDRPGDGTRERHPFAPGADDEPPADDGHAAVLEKAEPGTFAHALEIALTDIGQALGTSETAKREPLFRDARGLFAEEFPTTPWRVTGLVSDGGIAMLGAEPKSGKTWVATETAVAIATGTPVFAEFFAQQGSVAYFYAEDQGRQVRNRLRALLAAREMGPEALGGRLHVCPKGKYLDITRDDDLAWLVASGRALGRVDVLVLDPLRDISSAAEDKSDEMAPVMRRLRLLGELLGCTVVVAHHAGKPSADSAKRRPGQRMRGSSAIYGATDSGIYLGIRGGNGTDRFEIEVDSEIKGGRSAGHFKLELAVEDDEEGAALRATWAVSRDGGKTAKAAQDDADEKVMFDLVRTLAMRGEHLSKTKLRDHDDHPLADKRARAALERMFASGRLRLDRGKVWLPEIRGGVEEES